VRAGAEPMPCVLWGVGCLSLPNSTTAAEVVCEFRQRLFSQVRGASGGGAEKLADKSQPRVDLYRLVRIEDQAGLDRLNAEERVVAHLPDSNWGCREIEDLCRQRDDAETRYDGARGSLVSLVESLDFGEVASTQGPPMTPQAQQLCNNVLRQENKVLRYKLNQSEVVNHELKETAEMLRKEFMLLVQEIMPRGLQAPTTSTAPPAIQDSAPSAAGPQMGAVVSLAAPVMGAWSAPTSSAPPPLRAELPGLQLRPPALQQGEVAEARRADHADNSSGSSSGSQASSRGSDGSPGSISREPAFHGDPPHIASTPAPRFVVEKPEPSPWVAGADTSSALRHGVGDASTHAWGESKRPGMLIGFPQRQ